MKDTFKHFLITRYNVPLTGWDSDKRGLPTRGPDWLSHRQYLFDRYCVPGIKAQTEKNFTWLIYCDTNTPENALLQIRNSVKDIGQAIILFAEDYHACMRDIDQHMSAAGTDYVITSRVDNDDGLAIDYMETVQAHFVPGHNTILNLLNGHGYNLNTHVITRLKNIRNNHFGSLIEKCKPQGGHTSVRGYQHGKPPANFDVIDVVTNGGWLKTFHDRNLKSNAFGYPVFSNNMSGRYGLDKNDLPCDIRNTLKYSTWWLLDGLKRKIRSAVGHPKTN